MKQSDICWSYICCNGSKVVAPHLHAVAITWSLCKELLIQHLFLGICAHYGLTVYGNEATDAYVYSPALNDTYLAADNTYIEWYKDKYDKKINERLVLPVHHALQDHPESEKMWIKMINWIIIDELGFQTTINNMCIYMRMRDDEMQLMLWQVDYFLLATMTE